MHVALEGSVPFVCVCVVLVTGVLIGLLGSALLTCIWFLVLGMD